MYVVLPHFLQPSETISLVVPLEILKSPLTIA